MNTMTSAPLAPLLDQLFAEADRATSPAMAGLSHDERERLIHSKTEYLDFYGRLKDLWLPVSRQTGELLYMLARSTNAKTVVEFGTSFGISTLYLAAAVRDNFPGESAPAAQIIGSDMEARKVAAARKNIQDAEVADLVTILQGDALQTLQSVEGPIDFAFLDGRKDLYLPVLKLLELKLRPGAVILSDNIDSFRKQVAPFLHYVQSGANGYTSATLNLSDSMEFSIYRPNRQEKSSF